MFESTFTSSWSAASNALTHAGGAPSSAVTSRVGGAFLFHKGRADVLDNGSWIGTYVGTTASSFTLSDTSVALAATAFTYSEFVTVRQSCDLAHWTAAEVPISVRASNPTLSYRTARATLDDAGRGTVAWVKLVPGGTSFGDIWVNRSVP